MTRARLQFGAVLFTLALLAVSAVGYLAVPASMLAVVGLAATPEHEFLVRSLAAAFLAMLPMAWVARRRTAQRTERPVLAGLALYMFASSGVDLHAYLTGLVGVAAIPSIIFRLGLAALLAWLAA